MLFLPRSMRMAVALGLTAFAGQGLAQSTITFDNADPDLVVELLDGTSVTIDAATGNLTSKCELDIHNQCVGASSSGGKASVTSFARTDSNTEVEEGETITLGWTTSNADHCIGSATPALTGWSGLITGTSRVVTMSADGNFNLRLQCYNDAGSAGPSSPVVVLVDEATTPEIPGNEICTGFEDDPLVKPDGFTMYQKNWTQAFYNYVYPLTGGPLAPVGSWTLKTEFPPNGPNIAGRYITIPFVPDGKPAGRKLEWALAQAIGPPLNYNPSRGASSVWVGISTCKGDFRNADPQAPNGSLMDDACRKAAIQGSLFYAPTLLTSNVCVLNTNQQYYINIIFADPSDGLTPSEHTCSGSNTKCEANFKHN